MEPTHFQWCHVHYQVSLAWQSNFSSPGIILGLPHQLAHLSWDYPGTPSPPSTPVAEYLCTPELHWQSQDYPGTPSPPAPLWQSIPVHQSYNGSPGTPSPTSTPVPGLSWDSLDHPQHPCGRVSLYTGVTLSVPGLSWDSLTPQHPCGRVSWYTRVTQAVPGLSWDYHIPKAPMQIISGMNNGVTWNYTFYSHYAAYIDIAGKKQSALYSYA